MKIPTPLQIASAIQGSLPAEISYSGSDVWEVHSMMSLSPLDGDGGAPFAMTIKIEGVPSTFTLVIAHTEDLSERDDMRLTRSVEFESEA